MLFKMKKNKLVIKEELLAKPLTAADAGRVSFVFPVFSVAFAPQSTLLLWAVCCWSVASALTGRQAIGRGKIGLIFFQI